MKAARQKQDEKQKKNQEGKKINWKPLQRGWVHRGVPKLQRQEGLGKTKKGKCSHKEKTIENEPRLETSRKRSYLNEGGGVTDKGVGVSPEVRRTENKDKVQLGELDHYERHRNRTVSKLNNEVANRGCLGGLTVRQVRVPRGGGLSCLAFLRGGRRK